MGVHGLWQLIDSVGRPIHLNTLENKILAVDISIWINQAVKGFRDKQGGHVHNAHVLGLFHRICKLLTFKIKPVFVFDGGVPILKKQTVEERYKGREQLLKKSRKTVHNILKSYVQDTTGQTVEIDLHNDGLSSYYHMKSKGTDDLFSLPTEKNDDPIASFACEEDFGHAVDNKLRKYQNSDEIDVNSADFKALPPEIRHEILSEIRERRKGWTKVDQLPKQSSDFSTYQMSRLIHKRNLQDKINATELEMNGRTSGSFSWNDNEDTFYETKRVLSEETTHYILITKEKKKSNSIQNVDKKPLIFTKHYNKGTVFEDVSNFDFGKNEAIIQDQSRTISKSRDGHIQPSTNVSVENDNHEKGLNDLKYSESMPNASHIDLKNESLAPRDDVISDSESSGSLQTVASLSKLDSCESDNEPTINADIVCNDQEVFKDSRDLILQENLEVNSDNLKDFQGDDSCVILDDSENDQVFVKENDVKIAEINHVQTNDTALDRFRSLFNNAPSTAPQKRAVSENSVDSTKSSPKKLASNPIELNREDIFKEAKQQERYAQTVTQEMVIDCKELLKLFGIPFIISPMEAEAQCATLEALGLTEGTITDDSDIWLFGGETVYKDFFAKDKYVKRYQITDINLSLKLNRNALICLALMTGSDYTNGIEGIGPVTALEVLGEFSGEGVEPLIKFKDWWKTKKETSDKKPGNKTRAKFMKFSLHEGFPNTVIYDAYINPSVDDSPEKFCWGVPDLDLLRQFAATKFGWQRNKIDGILLPVMKKLHEKQTQMRIDQYFKIEVRQREKTGSKRLTNALIKIQESNTDKHEADNFLSEPSSSSENEGKSTKGGKKYRKNIPVKSKPEASVSLYDLPKKSTTKTRTSGATKTSAKPRQKSNRFIQKRNIRTKE